MRSKMTDEEQIESLVRQFGDAVDADAWENLKERLKEKKCPSEACNNFSDGVHSEACYSCKRYYADLFEPKNKKEIG